MVHKIMGEKITDEMKKEQKEKLLALLEKANFKVYTILRHVSTSGMYRDISPVIFVDGRALHIAYATSVITELRYTEKHGHSSIGIGGCGMDMGFDLVYHLSSCLYGDQDRGEYKLQQEWL